MIIFHYIGIVALFIGLTFNVGSFIGQIINFVMKPSRYCSGNYAVFCFYGLAGINLQEPFFSKHEMFYLFVFAIVTEILLPVVSWKIMKRTSGNSGTDDEIG